MVAKVGPPDRVVRATPEPITTARLTTKSTLATRWPGSKTPLWGGKRPVTAPTGQRRNHRRSPRSARAVSRTKVTAPRTPAVTARPARTTSVQPAVRWISTSGSSSARASTLGRPSCPLQIHHPVPSSTATQSAVAPCSDRVARLFRTTGRRSPARSVAVAAGVVAIGGVRAPAGPARADRDGALVAGVGQAVVGVRDHRLDRVLPGLEVALDGEGRLEGHVVVAVAAVVVEVHVVQARVGLADVHAGVHLDLERRLDRLPVGRARDGDVEAVAAATTARLRVAVVVTARAGEQGERRDGDDGAAAGLPGGGRAGASCRCHAPSTSAGAAQTSRRLRRGAGRGPIGGWAEIRSGPPDVPRACGTSPTRRSSPASRPATPRRRRRSS